MERLLECSHEEADDRMFHVNHAVKIGNFRSIAIASPDNDVLVAAITTITSLFILTWKNFSLYQVKVNLELYCLFMILLKKSM